MTRGKLALSILLFVPALGFAAPHQEAAPQPEITFSSVEIADGLYMIEGAGGFAGGNIGLLIGADGVVLIDDTFPPLTEAMLATVAEVTDEPVDFVINTHYHGDHAAGNTILGPAGALLVAHDNVRQRMEDGGIPISAEESLPAPAASLPVVTFADEVTIHLNGQTVRALHIPAAHTDGDAAIHFAEADVIHAGDLFFNRLFPFIDTMGGGSLDGYIAAQEQLLTLAGPETQIIPGHGSLAKVSDLEASIEMLHAARQSVGALVAQGKTLEEVVAAEPLADFESWSWGFIDTERMVTQVFEALSTE